MKRSDRCSNTSASCRLEWRPSRALVGALWLLGLLAGFSILASEMPRLLAWPLAALAVGWGAWRARTEARKPRRELVFTGGDAPPRIDGVVMGEPRLEWRGPLAFLHWRAPSGQVQRLAWWPDMLPAARRRELRLAVPAAEATRARPVMAP